MLKCLSYVLRLKIVQTSCEVWLQRKEHTPLSVNKLI